MRKLVRTIEPGKQFTRIKWEQKHPFLYKNFDIRKENNFFVRKTWGSWREKLFIRNCTIDIFNFSDYIFHLHSLIRIHMVRSQNEDEGWKADSNSNEFVHFFTSSEKKIFSAIRNGIWHDTFFFICHSWTKSFFLCAIAF